MALEKITKKTYRRRMSKKGQVNLPKEVTKDHPLSEEKTICLFPYNQDGIHYILAVSEDTLHELAQVMPGSNRRMFYSRAYTSLIDSNNRLLIPIQLRDKLHMERDLRIQAQPHSISFIYKPKNSAIQE